MLLLLQQCLSTDEIGGLIKIYCKSEAHFNRRVICAHIMPPVKITLFDSTAVEGKVPGQTEIMAFTHAQYLVNY